MVCQTTAPGRLQQGPAGSDSHREGQLTPVTAEKKNQTCLEVRFQVSLQGDESTWALQLLSPKGAQLGWGHIPSRTAQAWLEPSPRSRHSHATLHPGICPFRSRGFLLAQLSLCCNHSGILLSAVPSHSTASQSSILVANMKIIFVILTGNTFYAGFYFKKKKKSQVLSFHLLPAYEIFGLVRSILLND